MKNTINNKTMNDLNDINFSWGISTIKIFLDNINGSISKASELIYHKEYLIQLVDDLISDNKMMVEDFGLEDKTVKRYTLAIKEISEWSQSENVITRITRTKKRLKRTKKK